jgi:hypothetical protein
MCIKYGGHALDDRFTHLAGKSILEVADASASKKDAEI